MDQENRKLYNKQYYENNKNKILTKLTSKVNCEFCNRKISACNLNKHYTLPICERTQQKNKYISTRQNI
ncbi:MAG: hypothetical protein RLZZ354_297 [Pseudomonadota bacterium]|jgi:hypothetical protein